MATDERDLSKPEDITWSDIHADGSETDCFGRIWSVAKPLAGMSAWWVIEDGPDGEQGDGPPVLVARAAARHRVGRAGPRRYAAKAGRFVDIGERFRETDERSRFNRTFAPPSHVRFAARPDNVAMDSFRRICGG
jgi:hypothetical protein